MGTDDDHWISAVDLRAMLWHHLGIGSEDAAARLRPKLRAGLVRCCATAIVQFESEVVWKDWLVPQKIWSTDGALQLDLDHACWKLVEGRPVTPELSSACELELTRMRFPYADLIDAFGIDISVIIVESEGMVLV